MSDSITLRGFVASEVKLLTSDQGVPIASFELGSTERRQDKASGQWVDGDISWYHVSTFRYLAQNTAFSIKKGERVLVTGRLKLRHWTKSDGTPAASLDLTAESVGHDLNFGTAVYQRQNTQRREEAARLALAGQGQNYPRFMAGDASQYDGGNSEPDLDEAFDGGYAGDGREDASAGTGGGEEASAADEADEGDEEADPLTGELISAKPVF
ncbi:single-stranded DNA-binding protein [Pseudarthrobacter sp. P1]|uniref:single-stranded DNA-binding protein n=1 Tax=Pseudarthrobacter sp. P1 TaxID=3418418 RepID=UPI003CF2CACB